MVHFWNVYIFLFFQKSQSQVLFSGAWASGNLGVIRLRITEIPLLLFLSNKGVNLGLFPNDTKIVKLILLCSIKGL